MTNTIMPSKSVFFSSIQWASAISVTWICINLLLRPFNLSIGELSHEQVSALALVGMNLFVMFQRLKPQSRLYWIKEKINEITSVIEEVQEQENRP